MISGGWWNDWWWWMWDEFVMDVIDVVTSSGHWWCIFGAWWCIPKPKPMWWALWCVCGGTWLWLLFEFALFAFDCCLCEFFLFFMRRFWNLKNAKIKVKLSLVLGGIEFKNLPYFDLTLGQIQVSRQLPTLLLRDVSVEQEFLLEFERLELWIWFALLADGYDLIWPFQGIRWCRWSDARRSSYCWSCKKYYLN